MPTRELADQVFEVITALSDRMQVNIVKCIAQLRVQNRVRLPDRPTVLVGTPGKLVNIIDKHIFTCQPFDIKVAVIDEFDKTLEVTYINDIKAIFKNVITNSAQVILSSATINEHVMDLTSRFMIDPVVIQIKSEEVVLDGIKQYNVMLDDESHKFDTIMDIYNSVIVGQSIIFVNTKRMCEELREKFTRQDFSAEVINSDMTMEQRELVINDFRSGRIRVLIGTDLVGRGIDVKNVTLVVNYDLPYDVAQYIHRIGRTGRYGKQGFSINLITKKNYESLRAIESHYSIKIEDLPHNFADLLPK